MLLHLERVIGRKSTALQGMYDEPCIIEFKNGQVYAGNIDDYEDGTFWLYNCKLLDKKKHEWKKHGIMFESDGEVHEDPMPGFTVSAIKDIYFMPCDYEETYATEDIMQFYINPHYKPLRGIKCDGGLEKPHSPECDGQLHDALKLLVSKSLYGNTKPDGKREEETEKMFEAIECIRRWLLTYGAKIP